MNSTDGRAHLYRLLQRNLDADKALAEFCKEYEETYNFGICEGELDREEERIFSDLFDTVAWFASDPEELAELPTHFKDSEAVRRAVAEAHDRLDLPK